MSRPRPQAGLRRLPLSQYFLRGLGPDAPVRLEALRGLQAEHAAVVPLSGGPFNLVCDRRSQIRADPEIGPDHVARCLGEGLDVLRFEPAEDRGPGGVLVGLIGRGKMRVVLAHDPGPPTPGDWRLISIGRDGPSTPPFARLVAAWWRARGATPDGCEGDSEATLSEIAGAQAEYNRWAGSWTPPTVDAGRLTLHISRKVHDRRVNFGVVRQKLYGGGADLYVESMRQSGKASPAGLALLWPDLGLRLGLYPAQFSDARQDDWIIQFVEDMPQDAVAVARLRVVFLMPGQMAPAQNPAWWGEVERVFDEHRGWEESGWVPPTVEGGTFRLHSSDGALAALKALDIGADALCDELSRGLDLLDLSGENSEVIEGRLPGTELFLRLAPRRPALGRGDFRLVSLKPAEGDPPPFATLTARWHTGRGRVPDAAGDAPRLLREIAQVQEERQRCLAEIHRQVEWMAGPPPDLVGRIGEWRRVCELERELAQIGVTRLAANGSDYQVVPEDQEAILEWAEELEGLNPQGVEWSRYPLELRAGPERARLELLEEPALDAESDELVLHVRCDHTRGRALLNRLSGSTLNADGGQSDVRLYLPDSQLRLIEGALDLLSPVDPPRGPGRKLLGDELASDDQTLRVLQRILAAPGTLHPAPRPWPPLPMPPLASLSPAQEEAVRAALFGADICLIQGPPGTGKTTVILELLRQLFRMHGKNPDFRVLLVAPTHVAVDNVLERLVAPRASGVNLIMELGVTPYRIGSTRRIADALRGFTTDCFNTEYRDRLEEQVASAASRAEADCETDSRMVSALSEGATRDAIAWTSALATGELPPPEHAPCWPEGLSPEWRSAVCHPEGRARAWKQWHAQGLDPKARADLLRRWLDFLRANPGFVTELLLANANLVCATTIGCATQREIRGASYDYVIVDEAGKEEARRLLVPLIRGERWVLVGDHQQLPPYADDSLTDRLLSAGLDPTALTRSLFEELQRPLEERGTYVFLDRQGRMNPDISAFISDQFYGGRLLDFPHADAHRLPAPAFLPDRPALAVLDTGWLPDGDRLESRSGNGFVNRTEQGLALLVLKEFARLPDWRRRLADPSRPDRLSIGVISPYQRQVEDLDRRARHDPELAPMLRSGLLHIGTVDSFQGQERDLIVFTCTRSNHDGRVGFVDNRQRLNVALSRARSRLVVVVDGSTVERALRRAAPAVSEAENRNHLHALIGHARALGGLVEVPADWRTRWMGEV